MLGANGVIMMLFRSTPCFEVPAMPRLRCASCGSQTRSTSFWIPASSSGSAHFPSSGSRAPQVATTTGRGIGVLVQLWFLSRPGSRVAIRARHLRFDPHVMMSMVRLSGRRLSFKG